MTLQLRSLAERSSQSTSGEGEPVKAKEVIPLVSCDVLLHYRIIMFIGSVTECVHGAH